MSDPQQPLRIHCLLRDQFAHVQPVEAAFGHGAEFLYDEEWEPAALLEKRPDLVLCVNDYHYDVARCLDAAREHRIPSLALQDGILEWRCQYENPLFGAGGGAPQHQPVIADKIACLGIESARHIAAWGNADKVEVTGMPRLDSLLSRRIGPVRKPGARILVMTAKNPGFTPEQREVAMRSLLDVKKQLSGLHDLEVVWRVSKGVAVALGVENQLQQISSAELVSLLEQVDAVITTPSTSILEAMLVGRPVAALDYHNVPRFQQTAWTISSAEHIGPVVSELRNPPAAKTAFQGQCLANALECDGSAAERVAKLIGKLVEFSRVARASSGPLSFPSNLLGSDKLFRALPLPKLAALYPGQSVFENSTTEVLQLRLARAESENRRLKKENSELKSARSIGSWLRKRLRGSR